MTVPAPRTRSDASTASSEDPWRFSGTTLSFPTMTSPIAAVTRRMGAVPADQVEEYGTSRNPAGPVRIVDHGCSSSRRAAIPDDRQDEPGALQRTRGLISGRENRALPW